TISFQINKMISNRTSNSIDADTTDRISERISIEHCIEMCPSHIGKIFLTVVLTIFLWTPICYILSYKWIKFREEIGEN
ncbi:hypothetical protein PENTCL1PPCAC_27880, partial [Pristionchus entomophagus]